MSGGENIRKVKIVVLGDSEKFLFHYLTKSVICIGVGKSSFVSQLCMGETLSSPTSTVGCNVEVKLHEYTRSLSSAPISFFVEVWDMGSSPSHVKGRSIFYPQTNGLILVHDLSNRKSYTNLKTWLSEFYAGKSDRSDQSMKKRSMLEYDAEQFAEQEIPMLVVGTKEDQTSGRRSPQPMRGGDISAAIHISVDCKNVRNFSVDSPQSIEIMKFIDKVIEHKYYPRRESKVTQRGGVNRRHSLNTFS